MDCFFSVRGSFLCLNFSFLFVLISATNGRLIDFSSLFTGCCGTSFQQCGEYLFDSLSNIQPTDCTDARIASPVKCQSTKLASKLLTHPRQLPLNLFQSG
ncbi:hypothetical protein CEXT_569591 [Caerostris extrusa]|uniref:Secreted protein n=1 Tax=Caerostris extrusa TaxID=172846 RepID=A0AAV4RK12_CAEEX|nr:hypothetical protein CEXT_569591 [Caerostris extrusa]